MPDLSLFPRILRQPSDSEINGWMRVKLKPVEQLCSRIVFLTIELPEPYRCQSRGQCPGLTLRCFSYQAISFFGSFALKNSPPIPVTRLSVTRLGLETLF